MLSPEILKASTVLKAMVESLLKSKNDPRFTVEMKSFGHIRNEVCYGCAATVTLMELFGGGKSASELMIDHAKTQTYESGIAYVHFSDVVRLDPPVFQNSRTIVLEDLEDAVDYARKGGVSWLIEYLTGEQNQSFDSRWILEDQNWEEQIPEIKKTITEMIAAGL